MFIKSLLIVITVSILIKVCSILNKELTYEEENIVAAKYKFDVYLVTCPVCSGNL